MGNEAKLALEDGTVLKGEAFGYETVTVGELAFSTGMSGYTEALTDPSFKGQILMSTYPLEGNYGVSEEWYQSDKVQVEGFVVREACKKLSNFGTKKTLDDFLKEFKVPGIEDIDTRDLTLKIRECRLPVLTVAGKASSLTFYLPRVQENFVARIPCSRNGRRVSFHRILWCEVL